MKNAPGGEWTYLSTEVTDKNGRIAYRIPDDKVLSYGLFPIKMVVRYVDLFSYRFQLLNHLFKFFGYNFLFGSSGDHTSVDFFMAVIPPNTESVVFSIDGSFTASMSVTGRDPKVRAGAVDIVR